MEKYLPVMSEEYKRKHYAQGVFHAIKKKTAKISFGIYIFSGLCSQEVHMESIGHSEEQKAIVWMDKRILLVLAML